MGRDADNQVENAVNREGDRGNQFGNVGNAGNQGGDLGNSCGDAGNQVRNTRELVVGMEMRHTRSGER